MDAKLHFTKEFTTGLLLGLQHSSSMSFTSAAEAITWVRAVNSRNEEGKADYRVIAFQVQFGEAS